MAGIEGFFVFAQRIFMILMELNYKWMLKCEMVERALDCYNVVYFVTIITLMSPILVIAIFHKLLK